MRVKRSRKDKKSLVQLPGPALMNRDLVIDASEHVVGKLAAFVAKKALEGYTINILCSEKMIFTGTMERHAAMYKSYCNKRNIVNPIKGAFHYREPSKYFRKVFRNMACRKTVRGSEAANRIFVYEGIPKQFEGVERMIVPQAHRKVVTNTERKFIYLGDLLTKFGWHYSELCDKLKQDVLAREEEARKIAEKKEEAVKQLVSSADFRKEVEKRMAEIA